MHRLAKGYNYNQRAIGNCHDLRHRCHRPECTEAGRQAGRQAGNGNNNNDNNNITKNQ